MDTVSLFYVITGGPGAGKTTLLLELKRRGYNCVEEVARKIIREQMAVGGAALPWGGRRKYIELMLSRSVRDFAGMEDAAGLCFFDRGLPDAFAYAGLSGMAFDKAWENLTAECRYNDRVFVLPPWEEIYRRDEERRQSYGEAVETYCRIKRQYEDLGYKPVEVPRLPVSERADFVLRMSGVF